MNRALVLSAAAVLLCAAAAPLKKVGSTVRSKLFFDLYRITIFDEDRDFDEADLTEGDEPLRVELDVLYGGDVPDIPEGWSEELVPRLPGREMTDLRRAYRSLGKGDRIVLHYDPETGTTIAKNGETIVDEPGFELTAATLDIWFGDSPVSSSVKSAFLND